MATAERIELSERLEKYTDARVERKDTRQIRLGGGKNDPATESVYGRCVRRRRVVTASSTGHNELFMRVGRLLSDPWQREPH
jgi:hypothetical protein